MSMFNYNEHKRVGDQWYGVPFYSGINGYKLYLRVDANGEGSSKGTHVSVYVEIMRGENDEMLQWPFNGEITIELLNWREDKRHVEKIIDHYNAPIDCRTRVTEGKRALPFGYDFISFAICTTVPTISPNIYITTHYVSECLKLSYIQVIKHIVYYITLHTRTCIHIDSL